MWFVREVPGFVAAVSCRQPAGSSHSWSPAHWRIRCSAPVFDSLIRLRLRASRRARSLSARAWGRRFPSGDFKSELDPGTGFYYSGRANLSLLFLTIQFELAHANWSLARHQRRRQRERLATRYNLGFRFIRVGPVRPYILAGVIGSNQDFQTADPGRLWSPLRLSGRRRHRLQARPASAVRGIPLGQSRWSRRHQPEVLTAHFRDRDFLGR